MIYSVFQYGTKSYDYYDDGKPSSTHAGTPPLAMSGDDSIGVSLDSAAWRLPIGARKIGSGVIPRGRIASLGGISGGGDLVKVGLVIAAAYLAWRHFK